MCNAMKPSGTFQLVAIQPVQHRNGECRLPPNIDVNNKIVYIIEVICDPVDLYRQLRELTDNTPAGILVNISEVEPHSPNSAMFCSYHGNGDHASHSPVMMGMLPDRFYAFATELGSRTNVMVNLSRSEERFGGINRISMSHDSTWGPDRHLSFKPDVVAPGVNIFSTAPARLDKYETRSGTSMATPYVAGAIALYLQHHRDEPRKTPVEIRQVLQNAAYPIFSQISRTHPDVAPIAHQGAGFLSVVRMITGKIRVSPSAIPLGDSNNHEWIRDGIRVVPLRITNVDTVARKFYITYHPMQAVRMAWDPQTNRPLLARQSVHVPVEYPTSSIIIGPGATEEVSITIWEPRDLPASWNWVYSGYMAVDTRPIFHLTAQRINRIYSLPWTSRKHQ
ncbi:hypothetical protein BDF22DRAFT_78830 [Syncephalis plumigaleata]|nr:hypothetical protein BDF22DRAFT_78830 [Syncephalis plumigaleata]